jgi:hydroxyethylthiazole kinase-like uncharacterized protein yjeF
MSTNSERIVGNAGPASHKSWPLHSTLQARALESSNPTGSNGQTLMQTAGLALARLTLALAPHAKVIWIACGPGNNGGDGLQAAAHLLQWGKQVVVSLAHDPALSPVDARQAWAMAQAAGMTFTDTAPAQFDACIDALFGIGSVRPLTAVYADWVLRMNSATAPTIAVDVPSGLHADTGSVTELHVIATHTLSLLTLKPGLFTGGGRDACGEIWFNDLGIEAAAQQTPQSLLLGPIPHVPRTHASHKGSYGDVCIVGGASGMGGAALLAGRSALHGGAGRVFVCPLGVCGLALDPQLPELMFRDFADLDWSPMTVVAGCGGGQAIADYVPLLLHDAKRLILDADALNRIAESPQLQDLLTQRPKGSTVMTPHPLEAARLLNTEVAHIQRDRLTAAQTLAKRFQCTVLLKGSGSIIAAPGELTRINPSGNAKLATAGTGDVLAGLIGARMAAGLVALDAACDAVYRHGLAADHRHGEVLSASELCQWRPVPSLPYTNPRSPV